MSDHRGYSWESKGLGKDVVPFMDLEIVNLCKYGFRQIGYRTSFSSGKSSSFETCQLVITNPMSDSGLPRELLEDLYLYALPEKLSTR